MKPHLPLPPYIAVIDLETTGLDPDAMVLEVGLIVVETYVDHAPLVETNWVIGLSGIIGHATVDDLRDSCDPFVQTMHDDSGLWDEVAASPLTIDDVNAQMANVLRRFTTPLAVAGSGFDRFDRPLVNRDLPDVAALLLYWSFDVSPIRRLASLVQREDLLMADSLHPPHRALGDCRLHLDELNHWACIMGAAPPLGTITGPPGTLRLVPAAE